MCAGFIFSQVFHAKSILKHFILYGFKINVSAVLGLFLRYTNGLVVIRVCVWTVMQKKKSTKDTFNYPFKSKGTTPPTAIPAQDVLPLSIRHSLCLLWLRFHWVMLSDNSCVFSSSQPKKHSDGCFTSWQVYVHCNGHVLFSPVDSSLWEFSIV